MNKFPHICHEPGCDSFETFSSPIRLWYCVAHTPAVKPCTCDHPELVCPVHDTGFEDVDFS